jgi:hypothetical protein
MWQTRAVAKVVFAAIRVGRIAVLQGLSSRLLRMLSPLLFGPRLSLGEYATLCTGSAKKPPEELQHSQSAVCKRRLPDTDRPHVS